MHNADVMNVITKVQQNNHFRHSPSMMGSNMHVVNVAIKQPRNIILNPIWQPNMVDTS